MDDTFTSNTPSNRVRSSQPRWRYTRDSSRVWPEGQSRASSSWNDEEKGEIPVQEPLRQEEKVKEINQTNGKNEPKSSVKKIAKKLL